MKRIAAVVLAVVAVTSVSGCAKRRIDVSETGSESVRGTTWQVFCDGPDAFYWVPGRNGESDELEAVIYGSYRCTDATGPRVAPPDEDGIDEEDGE